jgi:hypothetical protein
MSGGSGDIGDIFRVYLVRIVMEKQASICRWDKKGESYYIVVIDSHQIT